MALPWPHRAADSPAVCSSAPLFPAGKNGSAPQLWDELRQQSSTGCTPDSESITSVLPGDGDCILIAMKTIQLIFIEKR